MRTLVRIVAALAALLAFTSCRSGESQDSLLIAGALTMNDYLDLVVKEFKKEHPAPAVIHLQPGGPTAGIIAVKRGAIDVATTARDVLPSEDGVDLRDYLVARDGIAIIVNPKNRVDGLTLEEVDQIVTGKVHSWNELKSWQEVGGDEGAIVFIDRVKDPAKPSHTRKSLIDLVLKGDDTLAGARKVQSGAEMAQAVEGDRNAVGFVSWRGRGNAKLVSINGVPCTSSTLLSGRYPLARSFYLVVSAKPGPLAEQFVEFTLSPQGQKLLEDDGLLGVH